MDPAVRTGERHGYASAVADLWEPLSGAIVRLERIAETDPGTIVAEASDELPGLQYTLHQSAELAHGIEAPSRAAPAHAELVDALGQARDSTADVALAVGELDEELVERLLPEWRGALFRVRLARLRALERTPLPRVDMPFETLGPPPRDVSAGALVGTSLVIVGALLFTAGAVLAAWPLWAAGLALFGGGFLLFRP
jgi:hypothetical protein